MRTLRVPGRTGRTVGGNRASRTFAVAPGLEVGSAGLVGVALEGVGGATGSLSWGRKRPKGGGPATSGRTSRGARRPTAVAVVATGSAPGRSAVPPGTRVAPTTPPPLPATSRRPATGGTVRGHDSSWASSAAKAATATVSRTRLRPASRAGIARTCARTATVAVGFSGFAVQGRRALRAATTPGIGQGAAAISTLTGTVPIKGPTRAAGSSTDSPVRPVPSTTPRDG